MVNDDTGEHYWYVDGLCAYSDGEARIPPNGIKYWPDPPRLTKAWFRGYDEAKARA